MDKRYLKSLTAVLLLAGRGSRISELTKNPKCLLKINNFTLLQLNINHLSNLGIKSFLLVVGYKKKIIFNFFKKKIKKKNINLKFINNKFYISKGNSYSLLLGLKGIRFGPCIFLDGDIAIDKEILKKFVKSKKKNSALIGKGSIRDVECAKTFINKKKEIKYMIDKTLADKRVTSKYSFLGEAIGIIKLDNNHRKKLINVLKKFLVKKENYFKNWEKPLNEFMKDNILNYYFTRSKKWIEIDNKKDYQLAKKIFR